MASVMVVFSSCDPEDTDDIGADEPGYVVSMRIQTTEDATADYLLAVDDLMTGEISAEGQGVELNGWNYISSFGDRHFTFSYSLNECVAFSTEDGVLIEEGKFVFDRMDMMAPIDDETFLAIGAPWGGGSYNCQLQLVSISDVSISKNVADPIHESFYHVDSLNTDVQLNAWPTSAYVEGDKLYISFYKLHGSSWLTPATDSAFVSVFSYPELAHISTFSDSRTSAIGYYGSQPALVEDEAGNHYSISSSSFMAGFTQATKPSGILRINAGEAAFDDSYFFNVEAQGYKVLSGAYAGNGKIVARVVEVDIDNQAPQWAAFDAATPVLKLAVLDVNAQTVTVVDDIPVHGGQYKTPYLVENGNVYVSVNNGTEANVYLVNPETASATKGASLTGTELQGIYAN